MSKNKVVVQCNSKDKGAVTRKNCANGCIGCKKCLTTGCPALSFDKYERKVSIDALQCDGCTVCAQVCPKQAITKGAKRA